ncbi:MAG: glycosyltransferase family 2 protein [Chloroflexi bacterium]|nr:glycosyltransferase family 2 protein [Chloroflexota bacterium]
MYTVVIPAYNAEHTITTCVHALQNQTIPSDQVEIIVVDDASTDNTVACAKAAGARVLTPGKLGKSGVRNAGAQAAHGDIILFTDSDCEPRPDWLEQMTRPFDDDPDVVGVKGAYLSRQKGLVARFTQVEVEERYDRMRRETQINFIDTYAAAYRRHIFLENGGFDLSLEVED